MVCPALPAGVFDAKGTLLEGENEIINKEGNFVAPATAANAHGGAAFKALAASLAANVTAAEALGVAVIIKLGSAATAAEAIAALGALRKFCINGAKLAGDVGAQMKDATAQLAAWTAARKSNGAVASVLNPGEVATVR